MTESLAVLVAAARDASSVGWRSPESDRVLAAFAGYLRSDDVRAVLARELGSLLAPAPPRSGVFRGVFEIVRERGFALRLRLYEPGADAAGSLRSLTRNVVIGSAGPQPLEIECYRHIDGHDPEAFVFGESIGPCESIVLQAGDAVAFAPARDAIRVRPPERAAVALELRGDRVATLGWAYDARRRVALAASPSDRRVARALEGLRVIVAAGDRAAAPLLADLCVHSSPIVRAAALRALATVDPGAAREPATAAANDPHPAVKSVAAALRARNGW